MFQTDPSFLRNIPLSEYRKRRAYWLEVRKITQRAEEGPGGVTIEKTGVEIEKDAIIIE